MRAETGPEPGPRAENEPEPGPGPERTSVTSAALAAPPALVHRVSAEAPRAAVLVLHGGRADGMGAPPPWNLPGARMRPFVRAVARATVGHRVSIGSVRYRRRGWNGGRADAARDADRALGELLAETGELPVVLVGHSMGGRAALRVAGHPCVRGVVGLAPWCPPEEPVGQLSGRRVVLLHGDRDRRTDPAGSRDVVERARRAGAQADFVPMPGGDHAMLRGARAWQRLTGELAAAMLGLAPMPDPAADATAPDATGG